MPPVTDPLPLTPAARAQRDRPAPACVDCRHRRDGGLLGQICVRPTVIDYDPVTGVEIVLGGDKSCADERSAMESVSFALLFIGRIRCGPEARFFEARDPVGETP